MSTGGPGAPPAGGWHADPAGRFEHRWWDGYRWTDQVSTAGVAQTDLAGGLEPQAPVAPATPTTTPAATVPAAPATGMLDAASFAIDFTDGGMGGSGTWGVLDPAGAYLGRMIIKRRRIGSFDDWYVVEDAAGQLLYRLDTPSASNDLLVRDPAGQVIGRLDLTEDGLTLFAPGPNPSDGPARWGTIRVEGMGGLHGMGTPLRPTGADIISNTGQQVGHVRIAEAQAGVLGATSGPSWFHVDRDPAMPDPMRALVLVAPIGITCSVEGARYRRRQARH